MTTRDHEPSGGPRIVVIGSVMVDRVVSVPAVVAAGATILGGSIEVHPGGKGANQAAAASRAGAPVVFVGRTGRDGAFVLEALRSLGVGVDACRIDEGASGSAFVQVAADGENAIVVVPAANARFDRDDLARAMQEVREGDLVLLQHETAMLAEVVAAGLERGGRLWLNASPADPSLWSLPLARLEALVVNETEAAVLSGGLPDPHAAMEHLVARLPEVLVIVTLGRDGAIAARGRGRWRQASFEVEAIDTVGCGDAFVGVLAAATRRGTEVAGALREACAAGALAATVRGAIPSMPSRKAIAALAGG